MLVKATIHAQRSVQRITTLGDMRATPGSYTQRAKREVEVDSNETYDSLSDRFNEARIEIMVELDKNLDPHEVAGLTHFKLDMPQPPLTRIPLS